MSQSISINKTFNREAMRRILSVLTALVMICSGVAYGQRHNGAGREGVRAERRADDRNNRGNNSNATRPGRSTRPGRQDGNSGSNRPGRPNQPSRPDQTKRPNRPGNNRPSNSGKPSRPGYGHQIPPRNNRPAAPHRPEYQHGYRPGHGPFYRPNGGYHRPAMRPGRPVMRPWMRPMRPVSWHPRVWLPPVRPLFGLSFGLRFSTSVNLLLHAGYAVDSYDTQNVWLNNVNEFGLLWPEALISYGSGGGVALTQLMYSTMMNDMRRYNYVYNMFSSQYGDPYMSSPGGGVVQATWFSRDGGYVQLEYGQRNTYGNGTRFFTTVTVGN